VFLIPARRTVHCCQAKFANFFQHLANKEVENFKNTTSEVARVRRAETSLIGVIDGIISVVFM
jgi:hypothetical protein